MKLSFQEESRIADLSGDMAAKYDIKLAFDLEEFSRQMHEALETGINDYIWDLHRDPGYEDLDNYEVQY